MNTTVFFTTALLGACGLSQAQDIGTVLSRTPVYQQVAVPHQSCTQTLTPNAPTSGGGALTGAIAGGVIGTVLGDGHGLGTLMGAVGGALLGNQAESQANSQPITTCTTQNLMENRLVGYTVVYEYAGKSYTVQLPQDPGPTLPLHITPAGMQTAQPATPSSVASPAPLVHAQAPVVYTPAPVVYTQPPVVYRHWPVMTSIHLGWGWHGGGSRHHHHRHWR
ncbi:MAG: hypothetical protein FJY36_06865 [Betaproteobacteria bacterium]|nr:hypothetical protein [Betaproteobacteria bacterium]